MQPMLGGLPGIRLRIEGDLFGPQVSGQEVIKWWVGLQTLDRSSPSCAREVDTPG